MSKGYIASDRKPGRTAGSSFDHLLISGNEGNQPHIISSTSRLSTTAGTRKRRSIRLRNYDYTQAGAYFITLCAHKRQCLFGTIDEGEMQLNRYGEIAKEQWLFTAHLRRGLGLDEWVLMPNHFHGIVFIAEGGQGDLVNAPRGPHSRSIGALMAGYKSAVTARINALRNSPGQAVWQRNYWERIIRNEQELAALREYIRNNPAQWELDSLYEP